MVVCTVQGFSIGMANVAAQAMACVQVFGTGLEGPQLEQRQENGQRHNHTLQNVYLHFAQSLKKIFCTRVTKISKFWNQFYIQDSTLSPSTGNQGFQLSTKRLKRKNTFTNVTRMTILKIPFLKALLFTILFYTNKL